LLAVNAALHCHRCLTEGRQLDVRINGPEPLQAAVSPPFLDISGRSRSTWQPACRLLVLGEPGWMNGSLMPGVAQPLGECTGGPPWSGPGLASSQGFRPVGGRALASFDQLLTRGPLWRGKCILAGELVETTPISGPRSRSAGRRPFHKFRNLRTYGSWISTRR
jgi:hypothetical protein